MDVAAGNILARRAGRMNCSGEGDAGRGDYQYQDKQRG